MPTQFRNLAAMTDLGVGSNSGVDLLNETEEQKKKRIKEAGQRTPFDNTSPAVAMLLGKPLNA